MDPTAKIIPSAQKIRKLVAVITVLGQSLQEISSLVRHEGNAASWVLLDLFSGLDIDVSFSGIAKA